MSDAARHALEAAKACAACQWSPKGPCRLCSFYFCGAHLLGGVCDGCRAEEQPPDPLPDTCDRCGNPAPAGWPRTVCAACDVVEAEASQIELAAIVAEREG